MIVLQKREAEEARDKQEEFKKYLKKIRIGNKSEKLWPILISFLTEETMLLNLYMTMVQQFLKPNEKQLKKNLNQNHQKQKLSIKNLH